MKEDEFPQLKTGGNTMTRFGNAMSMDQMRPRASIMNNKNESSQRDILKPLLNPYWEEQQRLLRKHQVWFI